jgi:hypothetical protein
MTDWMTEADMLVVMFVLPFFFHKIRLSGGKLPQDLPGATLWYRSIFLHHKSVSPGGDVGVLEGFGVVIIAEGKFACPVAE